MNETEQQLRDRLADREEELNRLRELFERVDALFYDGEEATYSNPEGAYESIIGDMIEAFVHAVREARQRIRNGDDLDSVRRALEPIGDDENPWSNTIGRIRAIVFQGGQNGESVRRELIRLFTEENL